MLYQIILKGQVNPRLFESPVDSMYQNGSTCLQFDLEDQSALYGVLRRIQNLGIELISVTPKDTPDEQEVTP